MFLTKKEEQMCDGEFGETIRKSMRVECCGEGKRCGKIPRDPSGFANPENLEKRKYKKVKIPLDKQKTF